MKKKIKGLITILTISLTLFSLASCGNEASENYNTSSEGTLSSENSYEQITPEQAKKLMDTESDYIIIDARTQEEFAAGHIEGAILIPEYEIAERAEGELPDKNALILVYCRSGRRSKIASEALVALGYTNVKEFGGIIDWKYEIVK